MKKEKTTHIICILDRSGSMRPLAVEVINSFNQFITDQKKIEGKAKVTLAIFDDHYDIIHDCVPLEEVSELTEEVYWTRGMTALNDAVGKTISNLKSKKRAIVLIQTDGVENASHEYSTAKIKEIINEQEKKGWKFIFLGAGIDAFAEGSKIGVNNDKTVNFTRDSDGFRKYSCALSASTTAYRDGGDVEAAIKDVELNG